MTTTERVRFPSISAEAFVSDTDRMALQNLQRVPILPTLIRRFNEYTLDQLFYALNSAEAVRCGPNQYPTLHAMLREACAVLHVAEPELYVSYSPVVNAYTAGMNKTFIVVQSALVESLTDDELLFVLGHEVGHIKCGHVLYQTLALVLRELLEEIGRVSLGLGRWAAIGLVTAFYEWLRQAEYSCDRAGLLVCQDSDVAFKALMKMGAGSTRFNDELNVEAFLEQARRHAESDGLNAAARAVMFILYTRFLTHPQVVYRAKGLDEWIRSGAYARILAGDYQRDVAGANTMGAQVRCPVCAGRYSPLAERCPYCAAAPRNPEPATASSYGPAPATASCRRCTAPLQAAARFCGACGAPVDPNEEEPV